MAGLEDLYQQLIIDHSRHPRNVGELAGATHQAQGYNPLCGDKIQLYLRLDGDRIQEAKFQGSGCAISTASASLLTEAIRGRSVAEAEDLFQKFHRLVTGEKLSEAERGALGKLVVLEGVSQFPIRVKCATLAWHTLRAALQRSPEVVSTE